MLTLCLAMCLQAAAEKPAAPPPQDKPAEVTLQSLAQKITIGGQVRFRAEYRDPVSYSNTAAAREDDDIYLERIRLNLKFSLADQIEVFFQPQDQRTFGDEGAAGTAVFVSDEQNLDVHQGYVEIRELGVLEFSMKVGRQELSYGDQRLVSPLDWSNIARAWDGIKLKYANQEFWIDAFATVIREGTGAEDDQDFYGLYASYIGVAAHEFDLYVFGREFNDNSLTSETIPGAVNDRRDWTAGARLKGKLEGLDYTAEGMIQRGDLGEDDIVAWATALTIGYSLDMTWKPRIGLEYTHASGDPDPADGDIETFDPIYPFGHAYQGYADIFAFKNGRDLVVLLKVAPAEGLTIHADFHMFTLDENVDSWYNFAGAPIRPGSAAADDEVGQELDLHARLAVGKHLKFWGGWSHFFAGEFVEDTPGTDRDMDWFFLQVMVDF